MPTPAVIMTAPVNVIAPHAGRKESAMFCTCASERARRDRSSSTSSEPAQTGRGSGHAVGWGCRGRDAKRRDRLPAAFLSCFLCHRRGGLGGWRCVAVCIALRIDLYWRNESIAAAGKSFDESRTRSGVSQHFAQFVYGGVKAVVEIDEGVGRPKFIAQFFTRDHFAGMLEQFRKNWKGCSCKRSFTPFLRSSPASRSSSNTPKRAILLLFCGTGIDDAVV